MGAGRTGQDLFTYGERARDVAGDPSPLALSDRFVLTTSRFNLPYTREFLQRRAERHRLKLRTDVASPSWLVREVTVTVEGAVDGIARTREAVGLESAARP